MKNLFWFAAVAVIALVTSSCGVDIEPGAQSAGQRCFLPSDCVSGLTCFQRVCTPIAGGGNGNNNSNNTNNANSNNENNSNNGNNNFQDVGFDFGGNCNEGQRLCVDASTRAVCIGAEWVIEPCGDERSCSQGDCSGSMCTDRDSDGYGNGCALGPDCDDRDPTVSPGERENCNTPVDDNCNGAVNEDCELCCPGGCDDDQFCNTECVCESFNAEICQFQNQPCSDEGQFANGFFCTSLDGSSQPRCYGSCFGGDNDTCPEPGSACIVTQGNQGICFSGCNFTQGCGDQELGCLPWGGSPQDGVCVPGTENQQGEPCDPDQFFGCTEGLVCVDLGNGSRCEPACRPFEFTQTGGTDCATGHCIAFSSDLGICRPDNGSMEGGRCRPQFTTCNADAVGCYQGQQGNQCSRLCRLDEGSLDCVNGGSCRQISQNQPELGVCF